MYCKTYFAQYRWSMILRYYEFGADFDIDFDIKNTHAHAISR